MKAFFQTKMRAAGRFRTPTQAFGSRLSPPRRAFSCSALARLARIIRIEIGPLDWPSRLVGWRLRQVCCQTWLSRISSRGLPPQSIIDARSGRSQGLSATAAPAHGAGPRAGAGGQPTQSTSSQPPSRPTSGNVAPVCVRRARTGRQPPPAVGGVAQAPSPVIER